MISLRNLERLRFYKEIKHALRIHEFQIHAYISREVSHTSGSLESVTIAGTILAFASRSEMFAIMEPNNVAVALLTEAL